MLDLVREAFVTTQQLSPPVSESDVAWIRYVVGGLSGLFLSLLWLVRKEAARALQDMKTAKAKRFKEAEDALPVAIAEAERKMNDAIEASERRMAQALMESAARIADVTRSLEKAGEEIWSKIDEANRNRVDDARNLATKGDLEASRQDSRKDRDAMENRIMNSISELRTNLTNLIMRKQ